MIADLGKLPVRNVEPGRERCKDFVRIGGASDRALEPGETGVDECEKEK